MDLKQMEYFKTIVDTGSINQAAKVLHMSQPPLSMSMKKLEEELNASLFIRGNKHVTLTEAGTIFYQRVSRILELADNTISEVSKASRNKTFSLGLTPSTIPVVSDTLARFSTDYPEVHFQIYDGSTFELQHLLDTNVIDAAFLRTPFASGSFKTIEIKKEPMICAIPPSLVCDVQSLPSKNISLKKLSGFPLSIYRRYQNLLNDAFTAEKLEPDFFSICDDTRTSLLWAKNGKAVAIFPKSLESECPEDLFTLPIIDKSLETTILFVHGDGAEKKNSLLQNFLEYI